MRTPSLFGLALLSSALLVGCGGGGGSSSSSTVPVGSSTDVRGGATVTTVTSNSEIVASSTPASYDFGGTPAVVPANLSIPSGSSVAIVSSSAPVLSLQGTGALTVNGSEAGASLVNGALDANVALPPSIEPHVFSVVAPQGGLVFPSTRGASRAPDGLTINDRIVLNVPVLSNGKAGFPTSVSGTVPTNGSTSSNISLDVFYPTDFVGYKATLSISWTENGVPVNIAQTKSVAASGVVNFTAKSPKTIPAKGVDRITLSLVSAK